MAVLLDRGHVRSLVAAVEANFYVSESMVLDALEHGSSFNLLHLETAMKINVFVLTDDALDRRQITRRQAVELDSGEVIWVGSADDRVELQRTADELGLGDLAARAIAEADSPMTRASH